MILLDTNVVSEVMRQQPSDAVLSWLNAQDTASLFVCTVTIAEICYGLRILPDGQRRWRLQHAFDDFVARAFDQRVLDFTEAAARQYATIMGHRREIGRPMSLPDGQISAIASASQLTLATRNVADFENCGLALLNPFEFAG